MPPKPKLTPEEKKELRAQKKGQKKLALIEKKKQLKRDVLTRELKYSNVTLKKYEKEWKQMLTKIALPHMRNDLEFAWHNFERSIDCRDFTISLLMDELKLAERQYSMNFRNHLENIDKFIDMYHERLEELKHDHDTEVFNLRSEYEVETKEIQMNFEEGEQYLKTMIHTLEVAEKAQQSHMRNDYFCKIEEESTKHSQSTQKMRGGYENIQQDFQKDTQEFLESYRNRVKERKLQYETLKTRDESMQILLSKQVHKLRMAYENIKRLKESFFSTRRILGRKVKDLEEEYNFFFTAFDFLKNRLIIDRERDAKKLELLTICYNGTQDYLEKLKAKGEKILHIGMVCRKLETQEEKITPFPISSLKVEPKSTPTGDEASKDIIQLLELFFQRVGQAEALRYAINEEREFLKTEQQILKMKVHRYCQCLSCPSEAKNTSTHIKHITEGALEYLKYKKHGSDQFKGNDFWDDEEIGEEYDYDFE